MAIKKYIIPVLLSLFLLAALASCGTADIEEESTEESSEAESETGYEVTEDESQVVVDYSGEYLAYVPMSEEELYADYLPAYDTITEDEEGNVTWINGDGSVVLEYDIYGNGYMYDLDEGITYDIEIDFFDDGTISNFSYKQEFGDDDESDDDEIFGKSMKAIMVNFYETTGTPESYIYIYHEVNTSDVDFVLLTFNEDGTVSSVTENYEEFLSDVFSTLLTNLGSEISESFEEDFLEAFLEAFS